MRTYLLRRLWFLIPTLLGITILNFTVMQLAPGGPVEAYLARVRFGGGGGEGRGGGIGSRADGSSKGTVTEEVIQEIKHKYGFDKPLYMRYLIWLKNIVTLDFGYSHRFGRPVLELIWSKFPVSVSFGVTSLLLSYLVCIPLGIMKALKDGTGFDFASSLTIFFLYSIPAFMLAILLIVLFAGGRYFEWFPIGGLHSLDSETWSLSARIKDQVWHMVLPLICFTVNSFATLTVLMKNSIIEEIRKDYVRTGVAKGLSMTQSIFRHAFRNALIPIAVNLGSIFTVFFASNILIEQIFNLDGFGKLFYDAALQRDYPVLMAEVLIASFLGLFGQIVSDVLNVLVDPRISYEASL